MAIWYSRSILQKVQAYLQCYWYSTYKLINYLQIHLYNTINHSLWEWPDRASLLESGHQSFVCLYHHNETSCHVWRYELHSAHWIFVTLCAQQSLSLCRQLDLVMWLFEQLWKGQIWLQFFSVDYWKDWNWYKWTLGAHGELFFGPTQFDSYTQYKMHRPFQNQWILFQCCFFHWNVQNVGQFEFQLKIVQLIQI